MKEIYGKIGTVALFIIGLCLIGYNVFFEGYFGYIILGTALIIGGVVFGMYVQMSILWSK